MPSKSIPASFRFSPEIRQWISHAALVSGGWSERDIVEACIRRQIKEVIHGRVLELNNTLSRDAVRQIVKAMHGWSELPEYGADLRSNGRSKKQKNAKYKSIDAMSLTSRKLTQTATAMAELQLAGA